MSKSKKEAGIKKRYEVNGLDIEEKGQFKCEICDYSSYLKRNVKRHVESVHEKKKPFQCEICKQQFSQNSELKRHIKSSYRLE